MTNRWQIVSLAEAKRHRLYGVKNWLIVFAVGLLFGVLAAVGGLNGEASKANLTLTQLLAIDHPAVIFLKLTLFLQVVVVAIIYWLLFTKHHNFRSVTTTLLLCSWPATATVGLANSFPGLAESLVTAFFSWALSCAVWVTYLHRSKRVRITFEHSVLSTEANTPQSNSAESAPENLLQKQAVPSQPVVTTQHSGPNSHSFKQHKTAGAPGVPVTQAANVHLRTVMSTNPPENFWSAASAEFDSGSRRVGLWAMKFSEAEGNESIAKAGYLRQRASELYLDYVATIEAEAMRVEANARDAVIVARSIHAHEYSILPKGLCANCDDIIPINSVTCSRCGAMFGPQTDWKVLPFNNLDHVEALRSRIKSSAKPTHNQVIFLADASNQDHSLTDLTDNTHHGNSLLHWCAHFGLAHEATTLLWNGANASKTNLWGRKPYQLCNDLNLREILETAAEKFGKQQSN